MIRFHLDHFHFAQLTYQYPLTIACHQLQNQNRGEQESLQNSCETMAAQDEDTLPFQGKALMAILDDTRHLGQDAFAANLLRMEILGDPVFQECDYRYQDYRMGSIPTPTQTLIVVPD